MHKIEYTRGTSCDFTHNYTAPVNLGATLIFAVKTSANDNDATDLTNSIMTPKRITMSGSTFPQTTVISILPGDVSVNTAPGRYYYSIKVIDVAGKEYEADAGTFQLSAITVNEVS